MLQQLFDMRGFLAHGYCLSLRPGVIALHVISDGLVALAYVLIPVTLLYFIRRSRFQLSFSWAIAFFAGFIVLCGAGHVIEIITIWKPIYYLQGIEKAATAAVSIATAIAIIPLVPKLLAMRTPEELQLVNEQLRREIAARRAAEAELERSLKELKHSSAEVEQFAYIASHDLQTPLRSVAGFAQLLARRHGDTLDDKGREYLGYIDTGVRQMQALIQDILTLSRVGRSGAPMQEQSLAVAVGRARDVLAPAIEASGAELVVGEMPSITGDHGLLTQLFQNLVSNALKFQAPGERPRIVVAAAREDNHWHVTVSDNGIGIPDGELDKVFRAFYRLHPQDRYEGSGVGLAICHKIALYHGGRIWAERLARGTAFHVLLPASAHPLIQAESGTPLQAPPVAA